MANARHTDGLTDYHAEVAATQCSFLLQQPHLNVPTALSMLCILCSAEADDVVCMQLGWHTPLAQEAEAQSWSLLSLWLTASF